MLSLITSFRSDISLTEVSDLLLILLKKCLTLILIHFYRLMLYIDDTLERKQRLYNKITELIMCQNLHKLGRKKNNYLLTHLIKNVPTSDGSEDRTAATSQHALLAAPLLLRVGELCGAGPSPSAFLLQGLGAVDAQRAHLILGFSHSPAGDDGGLHTALLALA